MDEILSDFKEWKAHTTNPDAVRDLETLGQRVRRAVERLADDVQTSMEVRGKIRTLMHDGNDLLAPEAAVGRAATMFLAAHKELTDACAEFEAIAGRSVREYFSETGRALDAIQAHAETIAARHTELHDWCGWHRRRNEVIDLELGPLVDAIENGRVPPEEIEATFEAAYCTWWSGAVIGEDEVLRAFSTPEHVATIEKFRELDSKFQKLTAAYICAKLTGNLPDAADVTRSSSWGILRHEIQKKRRHKPLRQLIGEIPDVLTKLHYRSRRESLIAFSNSRYYGNELITFPAPIHPDRGVRLIRPDGFYARGQARHNQGEAKAIVSEIVRRLTHADEAIRQQSIGVVTFNSEQQSLIENLLDMERSINPDIEWAFSADSTREPVFVKNLETVQGDERDVILFSITYGPDQGGHVSMNFGPLNRDGGERRLNVAMTRARSEMLVFSTLSADRIDLSRTQARAVVDLKHFLEYAERGPSVLGAAVYGSIGDFESPFESAVARALRDKGWNVHPQVGVSAYRIDLGIVHPDEPGRYLAGVECDGAMYHSSAFARERDKIRQAVLEGLGWTLFRVWSTDWWTNRTKALNTLHEALEAHLEADRQKRKEASQVKQDYAAEPPSQQGIVDDDDEYVSTLIAAVDTTSGGDVASCPDFEPRGGHMAASLARPESSVGGTPSARIVEDTDGSYINDDHIYRVAHLDEEDYRADSDMFYSEEYKHRLAAMIDHVIDVEGPVHEDILVRRIARHHGFQRAGRQIREIVIEMAKRRRGTTKEEVGLFFWPKGTVEGRITPARYVGRDDEMRKAEYICKEEIRAIRNLLALSNDPVEIARRIGIARLSRNTRYRLSKVLDNAE